MDTPKASQSKMRRCCVCGKEIGILQERYYDRNDTCGDIECDREMRDQDAAVRDDAHERLDRDMGWDR